MSWFLNNYVTIHVYDYFQFKMHFIMQEFKGRKNWRKKLLIRRMHLIQHAFIYVKAENYNDVQFVPYTKNPIF